MTLDEAIAHAREVASRKFDDRVHCIKCAEEHEQLAEWLEELKSYRTSVFSGDMTQKMLKEECGIEQKEIEFLIAVSNQVAEQLKAGDGE